MLRKKKSPETATEESKVGEIVHSVFIWNCDIDMFLLCYMQQRRLSIYALFLRTCAIPSRNRAWNGSVAHKPITMRSSQDYFAMEGNNPSGMAKIKMQDSQTRNQMQLTNCIHNLSSTLHHTYTQPRNLLRCLATYWGVFFKFDLIPLRCSNRRSDIFTIITLFSALHPIMF